VLFGFEFIAKSHERRLFQRRRRGPCRVQVRGRGVLNRDDHRPERRDVRLGVPREDSVVPHGDGIFDPGGLEVGKEFRRGKAGIEADVQPGAGKGAPEFPPAVADSE
jgi:hypothetical protein